jgi:hypothetical protein
LTLPGQDGMTLITVEFPQALSVPPPQAWRSSLIIGQRADGRRLWQWRSAAPTLPVRDTAAGLLVRPLDTAPHLLLVRRETGQILRRFAGIEVAVGGDSILQARRTGPRYALVRTRLDSGATTTFTLPGRQAPDYGVVAPGDRWVALAFPSTAGASGTTVAVADLHSGAVWPVPGVWAPGESGRREAGFAWSADGESLVVAVDGGGRDPLRIGIWRPDQPFEPVTVLPHEFTGDTLSIATFP